MKKQVLSMMRSPKTTGSTGSSRKWAFAP